MERIQAILLEALGRDADLHIVGGTVRDFLCGKEPKDLDLATVFTPAEVAERLTVAGIRFIETGIRRGTITAIVEGEPVEITTFRQPGKETLFSKTIFEDLPARDFTINAIAISLNDQRIVDPFDGAVDLFRGIIRTVGNAQERFIEDPHRILRMIRFGFATEGRTIEAETLEAAQNCAHLLKEVSIERIRDEFVKILCGQNPAEALRVMHRFAILEQILPELIPCIDFEQNHHHIHPVFDHIVEVVNRVEPLPVLRLAALFHDIAKPLTMTVGEDGVRHFLRHEEVGANMTEQIMERMKFPNDIIRDVRTLVAEHMRTIRMGDRGVRKIIKDLGDLLPLFVKLKIADSHGGHTNPDRLELFEEFNARVEFEKNRVDVPRFDHLAVDGNDILALGLRPGPRVGRILEELGNIVLDNPELNFKDILLDRAREML